MDKEMMNNVEGIDEDNFITLTDENGQEVEFEIITDYEKDGNRYFAMFPPEEEGDENKDILEAYIRQRKIQELHRHFEGLREVYIQARAPIRKDKPAEGSY